MHIEDVIIIASITIISIIGWVSSLNLFLEWENSEIYQDTNFFMSITGLVLSSIILAAILKVLLWNTKLFS